VGLAEVEPRPEGGRAHQGQLGLQRRPHWRGEPGGRLDDQVEEEGPSGQPHRGALPVQIGDGALDFVDGARPYPAAGVEHSVDSRLGQACLMGDVADRVRMRHVARSEGQMTA
jgi:hypothetical protein